jgi:hypothetical protein
VTSCISTRYSWPRPSQVDFGLVKELQETVERASGKEGGLAISAFGLTDIGGKGQRSDRTASEVVLGATVESYASRLLVRLEETKQLVRLGRETEIDDLRRGTVIVAEAELEEPGAPSSGRWELVTGSESAGTAGGRRDATESEPAETLGNDTAGRWTTTERWATESDSPVFAGGKWREAAAFAIMAVLHDRSTITRVIRVDQVTVVAPLTPAALRVPEPELNQLEGETAEILGIVKRTFKSDVGGRLLTIVRPLALW